jgi:hypothetical protein
MGRAFFLLVLTVAFFFHPQEAHAQRRTDGSVPVDPVTVNEFRLLFNQETGVPRLVLLLSPT